MTDAAKVRERIRRPDYGHLEIEVTVDDSKAYYEALDRHAEAGHRGRHGARGRNLSRKREVGPADDRQVENGMMYGGSEQPRTAI